VHLTELAARTPDKPAVIMADGSGSVTFAELDEQSCRVSRLLAGLGVGPGDHVAVFMANRLEYFAVAWGAQRRGTYWTPVNWHLTADEASYIVEDCGAKVLFASPETADVAALIAARLPGLTVFVTGTDHPGLLRYEDAIAAQAAGQPADEVEGMYFLYSSGTTGRPKGVLRESTFPPFGTGVGLELLMQAVFGFGEDTVYLCPAPLYHAAPLGWSMGTIRLGGTVVLMERFDPAQCLRAISRHHVTAAQFVPTHFVRMLKLPPDTRAACDTSGLRTVVHAAAPCPVEVKRQMIDWLGPVLVEYYAGSEGNGMTMIGSPDWLSHPGSVGRAVVGAVHILGEDGSDLPAGQDGAVYFDGPSFEYHHDPVKTANSRNAHGWSTLGDIGHLDDDGYLYLSDRRTDLILSGGVNIYPAEIEEALIMHPAVADVAVIGVPDAEMGESVLAIVQLADGGAGSGQLAADLMLHCRSRLASFKCPRSVEFVAELPRTPTGKLLRRRLREERKHS
jgi:acyl-CoA synthetase (AMP-forming)/AMP-acid ligase II